MIPLFLVAWGAVAVGLGVLLGRSIHLADCCPHDEAGEPEDVVDVDTERTWLA